MAVEWPLWTPTDPPVDQDEIDRTAAQAVRCAEREDFRRAERHYQHWSDLCLVMDRWRVRHGPTPMLDYVRLVRADLLIGPHHRLAFDLFRRIAAGELKKVMLFWPPGHSKSLIASILGPSWLYGLCPQGRILAASHTVDLVEDFSRHIKDLMMSEAYQRLFPDVSIRRDKNSATKWVLAQGGEYKALGVGTAAAGRRADLLGVMDDLISEQDAYSDTKRTRANNWYPGGFLSRMMPGTPQLLMMTRWHCDDPAGKLLAEQAADDSWNVTTIPAELDAAAAAQLNAWRAVDEPEFRPGDAPFAALWPKRVLGNLKRSLPPMTWSALYMQSPTREAGGILKKHWWKPWPAGVPLPEIVSVIQIWDTAFEEHERNDFNACTTWGVFENPFAPQGRSRMAIMLLGRFNRRMEFPDLREAAYQYYDKWDKSDVGPVDHVLVERKASGHSLIQELQRRKIPVQPVMIDLDHRGRQKSKVERAHPASVVLWSGAVYYPEGRKWPTEVIEQCAQFPHVDHDDLADTVINALIWLRRTWNIYVTHDQEPDHIDADDVEGYIVSRQRPRNQGSNGVRAPGG